jgi:very-short-patch-repair endonuclease
MSANDQPAKSPHGYSPEMSDVAQRLRKSATSAERRLWEVVRDRRCGYRIYRQVPAGQYVVDFYCPAVRLAIEVDGPIHDLPEVQQRDVTRELALINDLGMTILRLSNDEVLHFSDGELQRRVHQALAEAAARVAPWSERPSRRR